MSNKCQCNLPDCPSCMFPYKSDDGPNCSASSGSVGIDEDDQKWSVEIYDSSPDRYSVQINFNKTAVFLAEIEGGTENYRMGCIVARDNGRQLVRALNAFSAIPPNQ